jgi:cytochrome c oxidase subunit IV
MDTYRRLWKTWSVLLVLTSIMVFVDVMQLPRLLLLVVLLAAMLAKAALIAGRFMDLEHERVVVSISIAFSLLFFGAFLYALIAPDSVAILRGGR